MTIQLTPETGVPLSKRAPKIDLKDRAAACAKTVALLSDHGLEIELTDEDKQAAAALAADLAALLKKGVAGMRPEAGTGTASSAADMESWESDYRDPPRKPLDMSGGRKVSPEQRRREYEMMKDYDI